MAATLYDVLGVSEDADSDAIEAAYRERVKQCHPDLSDHPRAAQRLEWVVRAAEVLTDPAERQRYDRLGHAAYCDAEGWAEGAATADSQEYTDATARERQRDSATTADTDGTATADNGTATADSDPAAAATGNGGEQQAAERPWGADGREDDAGANAADSTDGGYRDWSDGYVGGVEDDDTEAAERWRERVATTDPNATIVPRWLRWFASRFAPVLIAIAWLFDPSYGRSIFGLLFGYLLDALPFDPNLLVWGMGVFIFVVVPLVGGALLLAAIVIEDFKLEL
jgi:curved DNA-binding protein CbpA